MLSGGVPSISAYFMSLLIFYMQSVGSLQMLTSGSHLVFRCSGPVDQKKLFCLGSCHINLFSFTPSFLSEVSTSLAD